MKRFLSMALCIVMALGILAGCGQKGNDTPKNDDNNAALSGSVSTNGSTSMDKVIGALKEQFTTDNPGVTVTYDPTGSGAGIEAVRNGSTDIGLASRALKDQEKSAGLQETTVALDGIAIIINADSKVADLTVQQIADIFTGKITDWSEVGGDPGAISCIGRESGSGTRDGFESITDTKDACKLDQELTSTGGVIEAVARQPQRHRLRISVRRGRQVHCQGPHRGRCGLHRSHRPGWQLPDPAPLRAGDQGRRYSLRRCPGFL